ncbi:hypothetical protein JZ751_015819 [Albula glossodonta]|uniref:Uncharacterized protein n=1 Tax=Albula glossodonta TaxID=121402 RepID=A0A8T2MVK0_9TELE|nr:hypothetical protein JZ751_015819 [Albula glossodonta]
MAESGYPLPPEAYTCPLCADILRDPVTIPCGDTCCLECIKIYWDQADHLGVYSCPQCRATFTPRPVLRRNLPSVGGVQETRHLPELTPFPFMQRDSFCDFCTGRKSKAVKSCLMCLAYYCETHVKPHYESPTFKKHKLVDETGHLDRKICPQHEKGLELFCRSDQMCVCVLCTVREHRGHNIVSAEDERAEKQKVLVVTQAEVLHIIQERMKELQELRHNVDVLKSCSQRAVSDCDKIFVEMARAVERWRSEIISLIEANERAAMSQAEGYVERLEQEVMELQRRDMELRQILETEDNIHFLQNFPTLCVPPEPMVPKVVINPEFSFSEITKTATDMKEQLEDICKKEQSKISKTVPSKVDHQEPRTRADFLNNTPCPLRGGYLGTTSHLFNTPVSPYCSNTPCPLRGGYLGMTSHPFNTPVSPYCSNTPCPLRGGCAQVEHDSRTAATATATALSLMELKGSLLCRYAPLSGGIAVQLLKVRAAVKGVGIGGFVPAVGELVALERVLQLEAPAALRAVERPLARVHAAVLVQRAPVMEGFSALHAAEWLLARVDVAVLLQAAYLSERAAAVGATVRAVGGGCGSGGGGVAGLGAGPLQAL